jgi:S-adenosylmethionine hydrolase
MSTFIHLIADYGIGDPAFSEVVHRLKYEDSSLEIHPTTVPPLSTVATGFWIEQLGLHNPTFDDLLIYSNTAPRTDDLEPRDANEGGELCYAQLKSGPEVVAVDAGYNLSFVKEQIATLRRIDVAISGSQFRSRDYFPEKVAEITNGNLTSVAEEKRLDEIPDPPQQTVCHVDGYGNIKTSIRASEFDLNQNRVEVGLGGQSHTVSVASGVFGVEQGKLVLAPGSTGGDDSYLEISLRGGSATNRFGDPSPGDRIQFS